MEYKMKTEVVPCLKKFPLLRKHSSIHCESVVPDTSPDLSAVYSAQSTVLLKSKEISDHVLTISGELRCDLCCLDEGERELVTVQTANVFMLTVELPEEARAPEAIAELSIDACEASLLNPRKLSLTANLVCTAQCYGVSELPLQQTAEEQKGLHARNEKFSAYLLTAISEKSFVVTDQCPLQEANCELLAKRISFGRPEAQKVGAKFVVRGEAVAELLTRSAETRALRVERLLLPYSQIVDAEGQGEELEEIAIELTGMYVEFTQSIQNTPLAEIELHAVMQLCHARTQELTLCTDAYSNLYRLNPERETLRFCGERAVSMRTEKVSGELPLPPDTQSIPAVLLRGATFSGQMQSYEADILAQSPDGSFRCIHRTLSAEAEGQEGYAVDRFFPPQTEYSLADGKLRYELTRQCCYGKNAETSVESIVSLRADGEEIDFSALPSFHIVPQREESLWEIARNYHSSELCIRTLCESENGRKLLLVPKSI